MYCIFKPPVISDVSIHKQFMHVRNISVMRTGTSEEPNQNTLYCWPLLAVLIYNECTARFSQINHYLSFETGQQTVENVKGHRSNEECVRLEFEKWPVICVCVGMCAFSICFICKYVVS